MFEAAGLPFTPVRERVPNSRRALVTSELARDRDVYEPLHERLFDAYWARGRDIGSDAVLLEEAGAVGLDDAAVRAAWEDPSLYERVAVSTQAATDAGVGGVPAWVLDRRLLISGAQPHEVFERVLEQLGHAPL
jgi:predicted DsbA family dithiol-disulfide isomerase